MSPIEDLCTMLKRFIHKFFILLFNIGVFYLFFCIAFAIFVIGFLLIFFALNFLLGFVGINLTALVLKILYGLGLPQDNTIYLYGIPIVLFL